MIWRMCSSSTVHKEQKSVDGRLFTEPIGKGRTPGDPGDTAPASPMKAITFRFG